MVFAAVAVVGLAGLLAACAGGEDRDGGAPASLGAESATAGIAGVGGATTTAPSGDGVISGSMVPLESVGLLPPEQLVTVRPGKVVALGPSGGRSSVRVTEPTSGASFAGWEPGEVAVDPVLPVGNRTCGSDAWQWAGETYDDTVIERDPYRFYFEAVVYCKGLQPYDPVSFLEDWVEATTDGTVERRTVDGRPSARQSSILSGGGMHTIWTTEVVQLDRGWLVLYCGFDLLEGAGAPVIDPLVDSVDVP